MWKKQQKLGATHTRETTSSNELFLMDLNQHSWERWGAGQGTWQSLYSGTDEQMGRGCLWRRSIKPRTFSHTKRNSSATGAGAENPLTPSPQQKVSYHWEGVDYSKSSLLLRRGRTPAMLTILHWEKAKISCNSGTDKKLALLQVIRSSSAAIGESDKCW